MITKEIKDAILDAVLGRIDSANYGMLSRYKVSFSSYQTLRKNNIKISNGMSCKDTVTKDGETIAVIRYKYAARKVNGMYKMLKPNIEYV